MATVHDGEIDTDAQLTGARRIAGAPFGWEVDLDLSDPIGLEQAEALYRICQRDGVLVLRGNRTVSMDRQIEVTRLFGPILPRHARDHCMVSNVLEDGEVGRNELLFHSDLSYTPVPFRSGLLHAVEISETSAPTRFVSAIEAFARMPKTLQEKLKGLNALHVMGHKLQLGRRATMADLVPGITATVQPVVGYQEGTGRPFVYVSEELTVQFTSLPVEESDALMDEVFSYLYAPENTYLHHWNVGDSVLFDNLATQHARASLDASPRTLQRTSNAELGYWDQVPSDLPEYLNARRV